MKLFAEITKTEELDDGTVKVFGYASTEAVDSDGEIITAEAMKAALPDYLKFGAVREMHQAKAAGTAIEAEVQDDGRTWFGAHIVDSEAVKKVKNKVYKGFSIGGKATDRDELNKSVITGLKLVEVSLVDRPANPEATFTFFKADMPEEPIAKSMYSVADFANVLSSLRWIVSDAEWEKQYEGDASPVPAQLREWLAQGLAILQAMTAEEAAELVAELAAMVPAEPAATPDVIQLADGTGDLAKAGSRNSKTDQDRLNQILSLAKELGATDGAEEEGDTGKAAGADDLAKAQKLEVELDTAKADLAKIEQERDTLQKRVTELEAIPAAPKGVLKVVAKAEDVADPSASITIEPITKADGSTNTVATLIKASRMMPNVAR